MSLQHTTASKQSMKREGMISASEVCAAFYKLLQESVFGHPAYLNGCQIAPAPTLIKRRLSPKRLSPVAILVNSQHSVRCCAARHRLEHCRAESHHDFLSELMIGIVYYGVCGEAEAEASSARGCHTGRSNVALERHDHEGRVLLSVAYCTSLDLSSWLRFMSPLLYVAADMLAAAVAPRPSKNVHVHGLLYGCIWHSSWLHKLLLLLRQRCCTGCASRAAFAHVTITMYSTFCNLCSRDS